MRLLGAVLAGGKSRRFGSDKALAIVDGRALIEHAVAALSAHAALVICCGRPWPGLGWLPDRPAPGGGPLGGLSAALHFAGNNGFDAVLSAPVDVHPLIEALPLLAERQCAALGSQWTIGVWPASMASMLDAHLFSGATSIKSWLDVAKPVLIDDCHLSLRNINYRHDLSGAKVEHAEVCPLQGD
ncbi:molybdenum cofactor guanylyltransferase [Sphingomonas quercus]|uniref:NTP transferase domain-containing protein n=1 Tax=Sphingomonas quercus TaxID=2842451 RepID=A0ABS6BKS5_9SPHN|nr:NTP transferase domain-containing protein [Sphingomonas quercus]MBU3078769.1 NTP transferase domain-containing protein [Sphingomonas quercus]